MTDFDLALETQAYQVLLEGHRAAPDDEQIYQDMLKAKAAMEIAMPCRRTREVQPLVIVTTNDPADTEA